MKDLGDNMYLLCDKSMAEVFESGKIVFYPNLKVWKKPRKKKSDRHPVSEYVWKAKTKKGAVELLTEIDKQLAGDIKNKIIKRI